MAWLSSGVFSSGLSAASPALWRGPAYPAFLALSELPFRSPWPSHPRLALALLSALGAGAAFALGARLGGRRAAWAAGLLLALDAGQALSAWSLNVHAFYGLFLLGLAAAAAAWADDPSPARGLILGGALGASLLARSSHFLAVPLTLALGAWRGDGARAAARRAAWPLAALVMALLPWTARNALQFRSFHPLDAHSGAVNLYAASRGQVGTATVDDAVAAAAAEDPELPALYAADQSAAYPRLLTLARRRIAAAPGAYALGCVRRWRELFRPWLWVFAAALFAAARRRARAAWAAVAVLLSLSAYGLVAVQPVYAQALRPLAAVLVGLALAEATGRRTAPLPGEARAGDAASAAFGAVLAAAWGFSVLLIGREALAAGPLADGGPPPAAARAERLLESLARRDPTGRGAVDLGVFLAARGRGAEACAWFERAYAAPAARAAARPRRIDCLAVAGRWREAEFESELWLADAKGDAAEESRALSTRASVAVAKAGTLAAKGGAEAARALARAARLAPDDPRVRRAQAAAELAAGRPASAEEHLRAALAGSARAPRGERAELQSALAGLLWRRGRGAEAGAALEAALAEDPARACRPPSDLADAGLLPPAFYDPCAARFPKDARLLADRGVAMFRAGRRGEAAASLRAAVAADPADLEAALSLMAAAPGAESRAALARALAVSKAPARAPARLRAEELLKAR